MCLAVSFSGVVVLRLSRYSWDVSGCVWGFSGIVCLTVSGVVLGCLWDVQ